MYLLLHNSTSARAPRPGCAVRQAGWLWGLLLPQADELQAQFQVPGTAGLEHRSCAVRVTGASLSR